MIENRGHPWIHRGAWGLTAMFVLWWTLLPFRYDVSTSALTMAVADIQWLPFVERGRPALWSDLVGNLALFAPFGLTGWRCLERRRGRLLWVIAAAGLLSLSVEAAQLAIPARRTTVTDLVTDVLGSVLGAGLGRLWETRARSSFRRWQGELVAGDPAPLLAAVFGVCVAAWAVFPGDGAEAGLWTQTQILASSFRRFPGWATWIQGSVYPLLLGGLSAALMARSTRGKLFGRCLTAWIAAAALGCLCEGLQLLAATRRPGIFDAAAFALGALPGGVIGLGSWWVSASAALASSGLCWLWVPVGDNPAAVTRAVAILGAGLLMAGAPWGGVSPNGRGGPMT